jgi:Flp pilus assembly protein TadG
MGKKMLRALSRSVGAALSKRWSSVRNGPDRLVRLLADVRGVSAIEFAIAAPVIMAMGTGILKFGVAMSQYMMLTNASAQGAMTLAMSRGAATPYASTITAITNAAPSLTSASITKTVRVAGTACTTDSACSALLAAGATALVITSYPCDLTVMGFNFKSGCTLSVQSAQMVQ